MMNPKDSAAYRSALRALAVLAAGAIVFYFYGQGRMSRVGFELSAFFAAPPVMLFICGGLPVSALIACWLIVEAQAWKRGRWMVEGARVCGECGYSLQGLRTNRCPECGTKTGGRRKGDRKLLLRLIVMLLLVVAAAYAGAAAAEVHAYADETSFARAARNGGASQRSRAWPFGSDRMTWDGTKVVSGS